MKEFNKTIEDVKKEIEDVKKEIEDVKKEIEDVRKEIEDVRNIKQTLSDEITQINAVKIDKCIEKLNEFIINEIEIRTDERALKSSIENAVIDVMDKDVKTNEAKLKSALELIEVREFIKLNLIPLIDDTKEFKKTYKVI